MLAQAVPEMEDARINERMAASEQVGGIKRNRKKDT